MNTVKRLFVLPGIMLLFSFVLMPPKKTRVWMIGDSTMCIYGPERTPLTGWGMPFAVFFDSTVQVDNRARGGRSTRTFLSENRWVPVKDSMQEGDYVLIQFGHNDEAKEDKYKDRYTSPEDYRKNLMLFVTDTRARKANPVLITPVSRMRFDKSGNALETHTEYSAIVTEVAKALEVPLIDLDTESRQLFQKLGPEASKLLFMQLEPGEHPFYPEGSKDNTHFNELGARKMAQIVLAKMREQKLGLVEHVITKK